MTDLTSSLTLSYNAMGGNNLRERMGADWSLVVAVRRHGGVAKLLALVESL